MRIRLSLTLQLDRTAPVGNPTPEPPHVDESTGALVEQIGQPRYTGFTPEEPA